MLYTNSGVQGSPLGILVSSDVGPSDVFMKRGVSDDCRGLGSTMWSIMWSTMWSTTGSTLEPMEGSGRIMDPQRGRTTASPSLQWEGNCDAGGICCNGNT